MHDNASSLRATMQHQVICRGGKRREEEHFAPKPPRRRMKEKIWKYSTLLPSVCPACVAAKKKQPPPREPQRRLERFIGGGREGGDQYTVITRVDEERQRWSHRADAEQINSPPSLVSPQRKTTHIAPREDGSHLRHVSAILMGIRTTTSGRCPPPSLPLLPLLSRRLKNTQTQKKSSTD